MNKLTELEIQVVLSKDELSTSEILEVLCSPIERMGELINITLFNDWIRKRYDYHSSIHKRLTLQNIELSNIDLSNIDLRYSNIINCSFKNCKFTDSSFWDSTVVRTFFWGGDFGNVNFRGSSITDCKFDDLSISGHACFIEAVIKNCRFSLEQTAMLQLDFTASSLSDVIITVPTSQTEGGYAVISPIGLDGNRPVSGGDLHSLNLSYATMSNVKLANLNIYNFTATHASISNSDIVNTIVDNELALDGVNLFNLRVKSVFFTKYKNEIICKIKKKNVSISDHETASTIRDNFKTINDSQARAEFNLLEKDILRKVKLNETRGILSQLSLRPVISFVILSIIKWLSDYGESPAKVFFWIFFVIFGVGTLSFALDWTCEDSFWTNIYFSIITFSTVGYGDISPSDDVGRFIFALEGLSGIFLMSVFVVSLAKKWLED